MSSLSSTKSILLLFIVLSFVVHCSHAYDFFYFAQEWVPGSCAHSHCRRPDLKRSNVLGLFPHYVNDTWPTFCKKSSSFNIAKIHDLDEMLHERIVAQYRDELVHDNDELLWEDLWLMHGTCTPYTQEQYFFITLQLAVTYDLKDALAVNEIYPSDHRYYKTSTVRKSIRKATGAVGVQLECQGKDLTKVWICLDASSLRPIQCPITRPQTCGDLISYRASTKSPNSGVSLRTNLGLDSAPMWISTWLVPILLMLLIIANTLIGYYMVKHYCGKRRSTIESKLCPHLTACQFCSDSDDLCVS